MEMANTINVFVTAQEDENKREQAYRAEFKSDDTGIETEVINIYDDVRYQEFMGFGGAFTEAAAVTFYKLKESERQKILKAYFDANEGLGYTFCRTHMNSCDFSLGNYSCADIPNDMELEHFNIERDKKAMLPMMKEALKYGKYSVLVSPWSPPAWMKDTGDMNRGGKLLPKYREVWAKHYARFIKAYREEGIDVWGVSVQNEPKAVQKWDSCIYTAEEERDFARDYLGPVLQKEGLSDIKLLIWDHNKERLYERSKTVYDDSEASKYVWGSGFHWYSGDHFEALECLHHKYPDKGLVFTEGCVELNVDKGAWANAERYGHDIIGNLNNYMTAWCDWNLLLDETGGPNHVQNYCEAPVIGHIDAGTAEFKPSYYYIGHFSKFIKPGSIRIGCTKYSSSIECVAFLTPSGKKALVLMNATNSAIPFTLRYRNQTSKMVSLKHSIMTLVF